MLYHTLPTYKNALLLTIFLVTTLIISRAAFADGHVNEPVGLVLAVEGKGLTISDETETIMTAKQADALYINDFLKTSPNTKALIQLRDGSRIIIGEKTALQIDWYKPSLPQHPNSAAAVRINMISTGTILYKTGLSVASSKANILVNTPHGTAKLNGSNLWMGPIGRRYGVYAANGQVQFKNKSGSAVIKQKQGLIVTDKDTEIAEPTSWAKENVDYVMQRVTLKGSYNIAKIITMSPHNTRTSKGHSMGSSHAHLMTHDNITNTESGGIQNITADRYKSVDIKMSSHDLSIINKDTAQKKPMKQQAHRHGVYKTTPMSAEVQYYEGTQKPISGKYYTE